MTLLAWGVAWLLDFIIGDPQSCTASGTLDRQPDRRRSARRAPLLPQRCRPARWRRRDVAGGGRANVERLLGRAGAGADDSSVAWLAG